MCCKLLRSVPEALDELLRVSWEVLPSTQSRSNLRVDHKSQADGGVFPVPVPDVESHVETTLLGDHWLVARELLASETPCRIYSSLLLRRSLRSLSRALLLGRALFVVRIPFSSALSVARFATGEVSLSVLRLCTE